jgi:hypothetical protein
MPYVPPYLRPGYIPQIPVKPDFTGKVHWPTNIDPFKDTNVIQPTRRHSPHLGIVSAKSVLKMTDPIKQNNKPLLKPSTTPGFSKFNKAVRRHILQSKSKRVSRRRSLSYKKSKKARTRRRTY